MKVKIGLKAFMGIISYEVGSKKDYERIYHLPTCVPDTASGVTIGVGYDMRYCTASQFVGDWSAYISADTLERLKSAVGLDHDSAMRYCTKNRVASSPISIEWETAFRQFREVELPKQVRYTLDAYPNAHLLRPNALGALVSVIYNRGKNLDRPRMAEMKEIKEKKLIAAQDYGAIALLIDKSKRLWQPDGATPCKGIVKRREAEAKLVLDLDDNFLTIEC